MKFTSEELANAMGLKIGDRIKVNWAKGNKIYEIISSYEARDEEDFYIRLTEIINQDYEILPRKKKVGDLICNDIKCADCPLNIMRCAGYCNKSLYKILEHTLEGVNDDELYNILEARLDKEVE